MQRPSCALEGRTEVSPHPATSHNSTSECVKTNVNHNHQLQSTINWFIDSKEFFHIITIFHTNSPSDPPIIGQCIQKTLKWVLVYPTFMFSINFLTPRMLITLLILYASIVKPISPPTFLKPFNNKYPWLNPLLIVPKGCSDIQFLFLTTSLFSSTLLRFVPTAAELQGIVIQDQKIKIIRFLLFSIISVHTE